jgi:serine/threonine-protein kinase
LIWSDQNQLYIVMEFVPGKNLQQHLQELRGQGKWLDLQESVKVIRQVLLALDYGHKHGVLHRDLKPDNIMLKEEPSDGLPYRPVITDLGLAKLAGGDVETQVGTAMGTQHICLLSRRWGKPSRRPAISTRLAFYYMSWRPGSCLSM